MNNYVRYLRNFKWFGNIGQPRGLLLREISKASATTGRTKVYIEKKDRHIPKEGRLERGNRMKHMSLMIKDHVYWRHFKSHPICRGALAFLDDMKSANNQVHKSDAFIQGYTAVLDFLYKKGNLDSLPDSVKAKFRVHCTEMSELELKALLLYILGSKRCEHREFDLWADNGRTFFFMMDQEISRRLYACFQLGVYETKETLAFFEDILHLLLKRGCGQHSFHAYVAYCTHYFNEFVHEENFSLLLLTVLKIYSGPGELFAYIEEYMLRHIKSFDIETIALCALVFVNTDMTVCSEKLLDLIGNKLLKSLSTGSNKYQDANNTLNILKLLRHAGYLKMSFYLELEPLLLPCKFYIGDIKTVLHTFGSARIFPPFLADALVKQFKKQILGKGKTKARIKDISRFVNTLGKFCYSDSEVPDIYSVCADSVVQELELLRQKARYDAQVAVGLIDCVTALLYVGKFHDELLDTLFGMPDLVNLAKGIKDEDLLLIHNTVNLEYPKYSGRRIKQTLIDQLQQKLDQKWTVEKPFTVSYPLEECVTVLRSLIGDDKMRICFILPHIKSFDVELYLNEENKLVQPKFAKKKVALEIIGRFQCRRATDTLFGLYQLKLRQLRLLGYKIITVYPSERDEVYSLHSVKEKKKFWIRKLHDNGISFDVT